LNIVIKFQEDGLLAIEEFGEKAKILFKGISERKGRNVRMININNKETN